jgi:hypothetical protein
MSVIFIYASRKYGSWGKTVCCTNRDVITFTVTQMALIIKRHLNCFNLQGRVDGSVARMTIRKIKGMGSIRKGRGEWEGGEQERW